MRFIGLDLVANTPDATGAPSDPVRRLTETVQNAVRFEELGFDGFGVGERHHVPFLSSAPPVVLSHIAAVTTRIRLFTGVTLLSVLDPVRVAAERSVELAVEFGDPVFSANGMNPVTRYAELIRHYRDRWAAAGRDPADALVGAGYGQTYVTRSSQDAVEAGGGNRAGMEKRRSRGGFRAYTLSLTAPQPANARVLIGAALAAGALLAAHQGAMVSL